MSSNVIMENIDAGSMLQGFAYTGKNSATLTIPAPTLAIGETRTFMVGMVGIVKDSASLSKVTINGTSDANIDSKNLYLGGFMELLIGQYVLGMYLERTGVGQNLIAKVYNRAAGTPITLPTITVFIESYFYKAPW